MFLNNSESENFWINKVKQHWFSMTRLYYYTSHLSINVRSRGRVGGQIVRLISSRAIPSLTRHLKLLQVLRHLLLCHSITTKFIVLGCRSWMMSQGREHGRQSYHDFRLHSNTFSNFSSNEHDSWFPRKLFIREVAERGRFIDFLAPASDGRDLFDGHGIQCAENVSPYRNDWDDMSVPVPNWDNTRSTWHPGVKSRYLSRMGYSETKNLGDQVSTKPLVVPKLNDSSLNQVRLVRLIC